MVTLLALCTACFAATPAPADEPCQSPYLPKLVGPGGLRLRLDPRHRGLGDGSDKLVTIGANPARAGLREGRLLGVGRRAPRGAPRGLHRRPPPPLGRRPRLEPIFVFDVATDPAKPQARADASTTSWRSSGGVVGPAHLLPDPRPHADLGPLEREGRRRPTALVEYANDGSYVRTIWMPAGAEYGYDVRVNPHLNRMLTSSFTGKTNYMRPLGELMKDAEAMKHFGNTMVVWDYHARKPLQTLEVPGAPLEIRWALDPRHDYAFTTTALTSKLWGVFRKDDGSFEAVARGRHRRPGEDCRCPSTSASPPTTAPLRRQLHGRHGARLRRVATRARRSSCTSAGSGRQVNMVSQSWDGKRVYFTSSLLANWDGIGARGRAVPEGLQLGRQARSRPPSRSTSAPRSSGRPHIMHFGRRASSRGRGARGAARSASEGGPGESARGRLVGVAATRRGCRARGASRSAPRGSRCARRRGEPPPRFEPPAPGTYELPPIDACAGTTCSGPTARRAPLLGLREGEAALVSFVYLRDGPGVPAVDLAVLQRVDRSSPGRADLAGRVVLVTVSFDPARDPPERWARCARSSRRAGAGASSPRRRGRRCAPCSPTSARTPCGLRRGRTRRIRCATY